MKNGFINRFGKNLMKLAPVNVIIIDDVSTYFNEQMLSVASANGNISFERHSKCDSILLKSLVTNPRDILIMDIKGTVHKDIGKDGFDVVDHKIKNTTTFVAITSAHKYQLKNRLNEVDYVIEDRLLTPIDFSDEMNIMIDKYLKIKTKIFGKLSYKVGKKIFKYGIGKN